MTIDPPLVTETGRETTIMTWKRTAAAMTALYLGVVAWPALAGNENTMLKIVTKRGEAPRVQEYLEKGADPNVAGTWTHMLGNQQKEYKGQLFFSVVGNDVGDTSPELVEIARLFIRAGVDLDFYDPTTEQSSCERALYAKHYDMFALLLEHGGNIYPGRLEAYIDKVPDEKLKQVMREDLRARKMGLKATLDGYLLQTDWKAKVQPAGKVTTTSTRDKAEPTHGADLLQDVDPATAWSEGELGPGIGEGIQLTFARDAPATGFVVINVWGRDGKTWLKHGRVKRFRVTSGDRALAYLDLQDAWEPQRFDLGPALAAAKVKLAKGSSLHFRIVRVHPGSGSKDTCVTELVNLADGPPAAETKGGTP